MRVAALAGLVSVVVLGADPATACTISQEANASVFEPASGKAPGHQPWISLWNVKGDVAVRSVLSTCAANTVCGGTAIAVDRIGRYVRPKKPLADGVRIQISQGGKLLGDTTVSSEVRILPAWAGIKRVSAKREGEGLCSPAGPVVRLKLEPTTVDLDDAVLLVYFAKPDPKKPHVKLARIIGLGGGGSEISLFNGLGEKAWLTALPRQLWVAISDGDGHVGAAIKI
jgi:hypothetical protein